LQKRKIKNNTKYEKRRDKFSQRIINKLKYLFIFFSNKSFENQDNLNNSSSNTIRFKSNNNAKISKAFELVIKTSSSFNNNLKIREALNNNKIKLNAFFIDEKYLLIVLFFILF